MRFAESIMRVWGQFLAYCIATQYIDRLLASSCRPPVSNAVHCGFPGQYICYSECVKVYIFLKFSGNIHIPWFTQGLHIFPDIFRKFTHSLKNRAYFWHIPWKCYFKQAHRRRLFIISTGAVSGGVVLAGTPRPVWASPSPADYRAYGGAS